jgi:uncharacterized ferritin-like protein (DUF455 family)
MMRQCEDEARHSLLAGKALHERGGDLDEFVLPFMGNYYEMFWDMDLTERLVALNMDIEAVGAPHLHQISERLKAIGDNDGAHLFSCINDDERRHARIGSYWLKFLHPDPSHRRHMIEACRAFTSINLANAASRLTGEAFLSLLDRWASGHDVYNYYESMGPEHEQEVTPLLARTKRKSQVAA